MPHNVCKTDKNVESGIITRMKEGKLENLEINKLKLRWEDSNYNC